MHVSETTNLTVKEFPGLPKSGCVITRKTSNHTTKASGAYLILFQFVRPVIVTASMIGTHTLAPGKYIYAGSARGPGGLRARISRHLRAHKKCHWHIDHLTNQATDIKALAYREQTECGLIKAVLNAGWYVSSVPGFGSSDCGSCKSHLLKYQEMAVS